jgi:hypothetical protein
MVRSKLTNIDFTETRPRSHLTSNCGQFSRTKPPGSASLPARRLARWDVETHRLTVPPGGYDIMAGASSADIRQTATLTVRGPEPP